MDAAKGKNLEIWKENGNRCEGELNVNSFEEFVEYMLVHRLMCSLHDRKVS